MISQLISAFTVFIRSRASKNKNPAACAMKAPAGIER
jgi:hypothetical protein